MQSCYIKPYGHGPVAYLLSSDTEPFFLFQKSVNQKQVFNLDICYNRVLKSRFPLADRIIIYQITKTKHTFIRERHAKERNRRPRQLQRILGQNSPQHFQKKKRSLQGVLTSTQIYMSYKTLLIP